MLTKIYTITLTNGEKETITEFQLQDLRNSEELLVEMNPDWLLAPAHIVDVFVDQKKTLARLKSKTIRTFGKPPQEDEEFELWMKNIESRVSSEEYIWIESIEDWN